MKISKFLFKKWQAIQVQPDKSQLISNTSNINKPITLMFYEIHKHIFPQYISTQEIVGIRCATTNTFQKSYLCFNSLFTANSISNFLSSLIYEIFKFYVCHLLILLCSYSPFLAKFIVVFDIIDLRSALWTIDLKMQLPKKRVRKKWKNLNVGTSLNSIT